MNTTIQLNKRRSGDINNFSISLVIDKCLRIRNIGKGHEESTLQLDDVALKYLINNKISALNH